MSLFCSLIFNLKCMSLQVLPLPLCPVLIRHQECSRAKADLWPWEAIYAIPAAPGSLACCKHGAAAWGLQGKAALIYMCELWTCTTPVCISLFQLCCCNNEWECVFLMFQHLMNSENSPIIEYYPHDFKTDLNGKQQEWEAVVLIPFIDEVYTNAQFHLKHLQSCL